MTKYATFGPDGILNGRYDSDIHTVIPAQALPLTEQQFTYSIEHTEGYLEWVNGNIVWTVPTSPQLPENPVPQVISMRQARLALYQGGYLNMVNTVVDAMEGPEGDAARITWEFASDVDRNHPLVAAMAAALPLSDEQVDNLFILAATL
jgi:hypothetical protein